MNKICTKCNIEYDLLSFYKDRNHKDGYRTSCKKCDINRRIAWNKASELNRAKDIASKNKFDKNNPEKRIEYLEKLKAINPNYWAERAKVYRKNNLEVCRERNRKRDKILRLTNPIYKLRRATSNRINQAIARGGFTKRSCMGIMIGCSWIDFKNHLESKFQKDMTWSNYGKWHVDHIIPCSSANNEEELIKLQHYTNLQPLWAIDNLKKSDKI
jgi:hypothetical protein